MSPEVIQQFIESGHVCPECGSAPRLMTIVPVCDEAKFVLAWICQHVLEDGKTSGSLIAALTFTSIGPEEFKQVIKAVQSQRVDELPHVEAEFKWYSA